MERVEYDEFGLFHENAEEFGLPYDGPPTVRRESVDLPDGRKISALVWGTDDPEYVFLHGGAQNAHTWDTVAMAHRPSARRDRPSRARPLRRTQRSDRWPDRSRVARGRRRGRDPRARAERPRRDRHVARGAHHDRAHRDRARAGAVGGARRRHAGCRRREVEGDRRLHQRTRELPQLRRAAGAHDPVQPHADRVVAPSGDPPQRAPARRRFVGVAVRAVPHPGGEPRKAPKATRRRIRPPTSRGSACSGTPWPQIKVPLMLARGMREQSVVDDADEAKLLEILPDARVEHVEEAGHSLQGDTPVEFAAARRRLRALSERRSLRGGRPASRAARLK